jgi:hypothetical protein
MNTNSNARGSQAESNVDVSIELCRQDVPLRSAESRFMFDPQEKPFVATSGAMDCFGSTVILKCLRQVREKAAVHAGLIYFQKFLIGPESKTLWMIEDGRAITALLPKEY